MRIFCIFHFLTMQMHFLLPTLCLPYRQSTLYPCYLQQSALLLPLSQDFRISPDSDFHATSGNVHFYSPLSQDFRISPDSDYHATSDNVHFYSPLSQDFRIFPDSDNSSSVQALVFAQLALMSADVSALFDRLQPQ